MNTPVSIQASWGNDCAESVIRISNARWHAICQGTPFSMKADSWYDGVKYPVIWHFNNNALHSVQISTPEGGDHVIATLDEVFIHVAEYDDEFGPPPKDVAPVWPPEGSKPYVSDLPALGSPGQPSCLERLPSCYNPVSCASHRNRRPSAKLRFASTEAQPGKVIIEEPRHRRTEPAPGRVPAARIDGLEAWWLAHGGDRMLVKSVFRRARARAAVSRPWYNLRDARKRPIGLWHAVEELERRVTLFNSGEAWLEWTWLIYGPSGIIEPVRRSWSASVRAEPGLARASGMRSFPRPPAFHPAILVADTQVTGQTTPDPDMPGMVLRT